MDAGLDIDFSGCPKMDVKMDVDFRTPTQHPFYIRFRR